MNQTIELTLAFDTKQVAAGQKITLVKNKIFGYYQSTQLKCTVVLADAGATIPVQEEVAAIEEELFK